MKKMSKVAAVLVAAGMLFTGVGTAYADDATATGTATPQTAETAPTNGSDGTKAATNAAPQSDADAKLTQRPRQSRKPRRRLMQRPTPLLRKVMGRLSPRLKSRKVF